MQGFLARRAILSASSRSSCSSSSVFFLSRLTGDPADLFLPIDATQRDERAVPRAPRPERPADRPVRPLRGDVAAPRLRRQSPPGAARDRRRARRPSSGRWAGADHHGARDRLGDRHRLARRLPPRRHLRPHRHLHLADRRLAPRTSGSPSSAIIVFAIDLGWLPTSGTGTPSALDPADRACCSSAPSA